MNEHEAWQVEGDAAELFQRYIVPLITSLWAEDLVERLAPAHGERALDVACGTGIVARTAADRMRGGAVVGLDLNPTMLAIARRDGDEHRGTKLDWIEGSALDLPFPAQAFDLVACQLGLQFFPDRARALSEMARVTVPGGRIGLSVFTALEETPVALALVDALDRHLGPAASSTKRAEHSLADEIELRNLVEHAGFGDIRIARVVKTLRFPSAREYVRVQLSATPQARLIMATSRDGVGRLIDAVAEDIAAALGARESLVSEQQCFVLLARKP
jgi:ubiquinone/menaquinone biosynthesis C-methylase UbiE